MLILLLTALPLPAQEGSGGPRLLFLGDRLDAFWQAAPDLVVLQTGERLLPFRVSPGRIPFHDQADRGRLPGPEVVRRAEFFDVGAEGWICVGRERYRASGTITAEGAVPAPLFLRAAPRPAIRLPLCSVRGVLMIPSADRFLLRSARARQAVPGFAAPLAGDSTTGWGIGDDMLVMEEVPHVLALPTGGVLVGRRGTWRHERLDGTAGRGLDAAPFDDEEGIMDIPFAVPPLLADLAGGDRVDLLVCDPSAGVLFLYDAPGDADSHGFRVIRLGGLVLATWARDLDGDGRQDLVVLRTADLNPLAQLRVIRSGRVRAQVLVYKRRVDGLPSSPDLRRGVEIPLRVGIRNGLREAELPQVLLPVPGPSLLSVAPDGRVSRIDLASDADAAPLGRIPPGRATSAFRGLFLEGGATLFGWRSRGSTRLYHVGS